MIKTGDEVVVINNNSSFDCMTGKVVQYKKNDEWHYYKVAFVRNGQKIESWFRDVEIEILPKV